MATSIYFSFRPNNTTMIQSYKTNVLNIRTKVRWLVWNLAVSTSVLLTAFISTMYFVLKNANKAGHSSCKKKL